jgi:hypothetical protein
MVLREAGILLFELNTLDGYHFLFDSMLSCPGPYCFLDTWNRLNRNGGDNPVPSLIAPAVGMEAKSVFRRGPGAGTVQTR